MLDAGARQENYVCHGMTPLAEISTGNPSTGTPSYYAHDHLGSTRGLYNASKASVATTNYDPYGVPNPANTGSPTYTYTGKPWSDEVDMYLVPYRHYKPEAGRWLTRDCWLKGVRKSTFAQICVPVPCFGMY